MEPIRFDGASIDYGVEKRLRRLNPRLKVTFSPYALDHLTGRPIIMPGLLDPESGEWLQGTVHDPAFYLWLKNEQFNDWVLVNVFPKFGHEELMHLEADLARFLRPQDVFRRIEDVQNAKRDRAKAAKRDFQGVKIRENKKRINDLLFEGKGTARDAKVSSYRGQARRLSSGELNRIRKDPREDGWYLPEDPNR